MADYALHPLGRIVGNFTSFRGLYSHQACVPLVHSVLILNRKEPDDISYASVATIGASVLIFYDFHHQDL